LAFLGTPEAAVAPLQALHHAGHDIRIVVTRADKRRGRGADLVPSPVKAAALSLGLPVTTAVDDVIDSGASLGVVVAFGRIIKPHVLAAVPMINLHFSLLPRWRGAAPVERALLAGDPVTGVCLMTLEEGLDTGPVHACESVDIGPDETLDSLRSRLVVVGTRLLVEQLAAGLSPPVPQVGEPTYAAKLEPDELRLDWTQTALQLHRVVRLGRAWTTWRGKRLRVLQARPLAGAAGRPEAPPGTLDGLLVATGEGALELIEVQPEGKQPMPAARWRNGARPVAGECLGR
jgi:methionyl-tRNA formyltransferase